MRKLQREKKRQIPATCPRLPGRGGQAELADDGGSRMSRIPSSICVEYIDQGWTERPLEESSLRRLGEASERASCWLWHKREGTSWKAGGEGQ